MSSYTDFWSIGISDACSKDFAPWDSFGRWHRVCPGCPWALCAHSNLQGCLGCGCVVLRHHSYIQIAFRDPTLFLFSVGHSMPKAGNPPCVSTSQKRRAGDKLQHCVFQTDYETKNERQVWTFLQPLLSSRRARATCHYKHWDIWNRFMWVHGVWMFVRGKSLILCSFPWQAAPASAWKHTQILCTVNAERRMFWLGSKTVLTVTSSDVLPFRWGRILHLALTYHV